MKFNSKDIKNSISNDINTRHNIKWRLSICLITYMSQSLVYYLQRNIPFVPKHGNSHIRYIQHLSRLFEKKYLMIGIIIYDVKSIKVTIYKNNKNKQKKFFTLHVDKS